MILVNTFYAYNELRNFSYLIFDDQTGDSWVIDPYEASTIIDYIKKNSLNLKGILNTHGHFDHIRGNKELAQVFKAPVCEVKNSSVIQLNDKFSIEGLYTPGHTMDHTVFLWKEVDEIKALFSGDTLFNSGVGNCKSGGDVNLLYDTTMKLKREIPDTALLYPGHDYRKRNLEFALRVEPENKAIYEELRRIENFETEKLPATTLGSELLLNPFFRLDSQEIQEELGTKESKNLFIKLRSLRDTW